MTDAVYQKDSPWFPYNKENSIFTANDSIWTYNCPCPSPLHTHKKHVCRFNTPASSVDTTLDGVLKEVYQSLSSLFTQRGTVQEAAPTSHAVEPETYTEFKDFEAFLKKNGLPPIRMRLCYNGPTCRFLHSSCTFAHSIEEMIDVFSDLRVIRFYQEEARIKNSAYGRSTGNMAIMPPRKMRCPSPTCAGKHNLEAKLVARTGYTCQLIYPYVHLICKDCKRVVNVPIYK